MRKPNLPHDRDEAPDPKAHAPRPEGEQAAKDLDAGLVDTDLHGIRGVEKAVTPSKPRTQTPQGGA